MPDFQQTRSGLQQGRQETEQARLASFATAQRLSALEKQRAALDRQKGDNNAAYREKAAALDRQIAAEKANQAKQQETYQAARGRLAATQKDFDLFLDPRRELSAAFSNETPFLLFPLRIETRFKTVNQQPQLWVRVYPDECLVDSFEPLLSRNEVNNAARFWAEFYSAGKPADPAHPSEEILGRQKAAWALLVKAHGDGRAAWITQQLKPDEGKSNFPVRNPRTVILAIASDNWNPAQQAAITGLFSKLWFANGAADQVKTIKSDFNAANPGLDADTVIDTYQPVNFDQKPPLGVKRPDTDLQVAVIVFPDLNSKIGKGQGWTQATRVNMLPERLALIRYKGQTAMEPIFGNAIPYPLYTGPDPSDADAQFKPDAKGDLVFGDSIQWLADFDRAVRDGMGFRVNLAADEQGGFSRILVLGVKLGADEQEGKKELQTLIDHHYYGKKGMRIVPQGTPTNNTGSADSGYTSADTPDQTFDRYFNQTPAFAIDNDWNKRRDGQWLAEWLGIDYAATTKLLHGDGQDQADARNMNTALWPATLGYVMGSLMEGGFTDTQVAHTRDFFNRLVSGRGPIPAIRIGNQPYGIQPTSAFGRLGWMNPNTRPGVAVNAGGSYLQGLYQLLLRIHNYWLTNFGPTLKHIREGGSPYQTLLDIIGLHPNSQTFHRRYLETLIEMTNAMSLIKPAFHENSALVNNNMTFLKTNLGYPTDALPQIAALLGLPWPSPVKFLIDDVPLAEDKNIRPYTADNRNYIKALIDEALASLDDLRTGKGLTERPQAELYRLLKFALEQSYYTSSVDAADSVNAFPKNKIASMKTEQPFMHQQWQGQVTESRYALLYDTVPAISPTKMVSEYIRDSLHLAVKPAYSAYLSAQVTALDQLKDATTARLERAMVETVDCCTYRLDAWKTGLLTAGLSTLRQNGGAVDENQRKTGIYIGAYGWLENVAPDRLKKMTPARLPQDVQQDFNPDGSKQFLTDAENEGYIHAPSLNQGVTAAVLRNGYISHGKPDANNVLAVNLSSERIRKALSVIEGIQAGQNLAAVLGYQLERELHDRDDLLAKKIDSYIYPLRKQFPLVADQLKDTKSSATTDPSVDPVTVPITAIEARNVVHGVHLIQHVQAQTLPANKSYPYGLTTLKNDDAAVAAAITEAVNHLIDVNDAIADTGMAESVHHMLLGNTDRAAGVMDSYNKGNYPQEPEVIKTPRGGATLTHRVGIPFSYVGLAAGSGPRAQSEPSVNAWLAGILPPMNTIVCSCSYTDRADGLTKSIDVSLQDIGVKPIDLVYLVKGNDAQALTALDERFGFFLHTTLDLQVDADIVFNYTADAADDTHFTVFQLMSMVRSLRALLVESVPLKPTDVALPNETSQQDKPVPELPAQRVTDLVAALQAVLTAARQPTGILTYFNGLPKLTDATDPDLAAMRSSIDDTLKRSAALLVALSTFGIPQSGNSELFIQRQQWFAGAKDKLKALVARWKKNADDYAALAADPTPNTEKLQAMERLISATPTAPEAITLPIVQNKKLAFDNAFTALKNVNADRQAGLAALIAAIQGLSIAPVDIVPWDIDPLLKQIPLFVYTLQARLNTIVDDIEKKRIPGVQAILTALPGLSPQDQATQIEAAARIILGDEFRLVPRYGLDPAQAAELANSWGAEDDLLAFSKAAHGHPTEFWLNGMARVRDKMKHAENCLLMRQAFALDEKAFAMHPAQLPFKSADYHWLALAYPETIDLEESNTLLFTAFCASDAPAPGEVCGMLADEWIERIPAKEEITGITFHYDRPNSESPQAWLLVTPTQFTGNWQWNDLVDSLIYTLDSARLRTVEPDQLDTKPFASLLPAVVAPESLRPLSIVLDNKVHYMNLQL